MSFIKYFKEFIDTLFPIGVALFWITLGLFLFLVALKVVYNMKYNHRTICDSEGEEREEKLRVK